MTQALQVLTQYNQLFCFDERQNIQLTDERCLIKFTTGDFQLLGEALSKLFKTAFPVREKHPLADEQRETLYTLRIKTASAFGEAAMHKIWEEQRFTNDLQDQLALKSERLRVSEEKSKA